MHLFTQSRRSRRARIAAFSAAALAVALSFSAVGTSASAAVNTYFELDGNVLDNGDALPSSPDWGASTTGNLTNSIFRMTDDAQAPPVERSPLPTNFFDAGFSRDFIPGSTGDNSSFTGGGSKDISDVSQWACKSETNTTDKGDIQNAYAAVATDPATGNLLLYFGMEKNAPNGNNNMGVWFLQDGSVACDGTGVGGNGKAFTGIHTDGDILLVAAFTNGGATPTISAFKWIGGTNGSLSGVQNTGGACGTSGSANLCAITNDTTDVTTPWQTTNKGSVTPQNKTGQGTTLNADQFYEGAVDLTANHLDVDSNGDPVCVNRFVFNTRSSQETTASLYDFAAGDVQTCFSPTLTTLLKKDVAPAGAGAEDVSLPADGNHTVTLPASVYDTSTLTGGVADPTGTITYSLWRNNTCTTASTDPTFTGGVNTATVTVGSPSPTLVFNNVGNYWWKAHYTPSASSRNNPADSACASEPLIVGPATPSIATKILLSDTAKVTGVTGGGTPTGSVVFTLYPSLDCSGTAVYTSTSVTLNGSGVASTPQATAVNAGNYSWKVEFTPTAGSNYTAKTTTCSPAADETAVIGYQSPSPITP
jgi:hypothetical protein